MKSYIRFFYLIIIMAVGINCTDSDTQATPSEDNPVTLKYLALGDSYTIGQSVCETCRFPSQLTDSLANHFGQNATLSLKIIAQTGWTTSNLKTAITNDTSLASDHDLVTLLIGVNNQYQNKPFSLYEQEFPELLETAIALGKGQKSNVIVVSIPDYAYTPFGQGTGNMTAISSGVDQYNAFAESYCLQNNIAFVNITDITRQGLNDPTLVASDGLHPSETAYTKFVNRIFPKAIVALQ